MWSDRGIVQAVLIKGGKVLLATYPHNERVPCHDRAGQNAELGTIWGYSVARKQQIWTATDQSQDIKEVHGIVATFPNTKWMGVHYRADRPQTNRWT